MSRKNRGVVVEEQETETQVEETQVEETQEEEVQELAAGEQVAAKCDELKACLKTAAMLYHELELVGQTKRTRAEYDKMDDRKVKLVKRATKSGNKEEREAAKAAKHEERIAKLKAQLAKLTEDDE